MDNETQEELARIFTKKFQDYNEEVLEDIGKIIKQFSTLTPSQAHILGQQLRYNTNVRSLIRKMIEITGKSEKEINDIFETIAKDNIEFADVYYKAKGLDTPLYEKSGELQKIVNSVANNTNKEMINISRSTGFRLLDIDKNPLLLDIDETYKEVIDRCIYAIDTGQETYQQTMKKTIDQLVNSGVRNIEYETGYSQRIDTAVRRNLLDGMRQTSNEIQKQLGEEFDADGVEISVHINPAPDHEMVQGKQFSNKEFKNFQNDLTATSYDGVVFEPEVNGKDRRSISELNCYHYIRSIVLGVSEPLYSEQELKEIRETNDKGFELDGEHYSMYEGTQIQRKLETEIRKAKDSQIINKASGFDDEVLKDQMRIAELTNKYKQVCEISGLQNKLKQRARVSNYRRKRIVK